MRIAVDLGWRNELYPVYGEGGEVLFAMERSATPLFGVVTFGVHMTVYVPPTSFQPMRIWTPKRSEDKPTFPGMFDNSVCLLCMGLIVGCWGDHLRQFCPGDFGQGI